MLQWVALLRVEYSSSLSSLYFARGESCGKKNLFNLLNQAVIELHKSKSEYFFKV